MTADYARRAARQPFTAALRDIFSDPFHSRAVAAAILMWKGGTVLYLARSIYENRRFEDLPILADTLREAGCTDANILGNCRSQGDHVRGCWVVEAVLERGEKPFSYR